MDKEFLAESEELIASLGKGIMAYEKAWKSGKKIDPEILNSIFRYAHTLKGSSGFFGLKKLSRLAHAIENLLSRLRLGQMILSQPIIDQLFESVEKLEQLLTAGDEEGLNLESFITKLNNAAEAQANVVQENTVLENSVVPVDILKALSEYEEHRLEENIRDKANLCLVRAVFPLDIIDTKLKMLKDWLNEHGEVIALLPTCEQRRVPAMTFNLLFAAKTDLQKLGKFLLRYKYQLKVLGPP